MILLSHSSVHGGFPHENSAIMFNNFFLDAIVLGNIGVDIFFLISGYFLCYQTTLNYSALFRLLFQVLFYSIICYGIHLSIGNNFVLKEFIPVILPTIFEEYWFFTAYILVLLISPYINTLIKNANQPTLRNCIICIMVLWCIIPTFTSQNMYANKLTSSLLLYMIGAYNKMSHFNWKKYNIILVTISSVLLFLSSIIIRLLSYKIVFLAPHINYFYSRTSILSIGISTGIFTIFVFSKERHNKFINLFASTVFGIYLIHENPFIKNLIWGKLLDNTPFYNSALLPVRIIFSVCIVYVTCSIIELIRKKYIEPLTIQFINKHSKQIKELPFVTDKTKKN